MGEAVWAEIVEVTVSSSLSAELEAFSRISRLTKEEIVRKALEDYLFIRHFRSLRARIVEHVEQERPQGYTDEEVFGMIS